MNYKIKQAEGMDIRPRDPKFDFWQHWHPIALMEDVDLKRSTPITLGLQAWLKYWLEAKSFSVDYVHADH